MALRTAHFESEYAKISGHTAHLMAAERNRMKHMEQLLVQFENDTLRSELQQANDQLVKTNRIELDVRLQLHEVQREADHLRNIVQASSNEIEVLNVGGAKSFNPMHILVFT